MADGSMIKNTLPLSSLLEEFIGCNDSTTIDLNSNVVKDTTSVPLIDICSDDDDSGLELGLTNFDPETCNVSLLSPVNKGPLFSPSPIIVDTESGSSKENPPSNVNSSFVTNESSPLHSQSLPKNDETIVACISSKTPDTSAKLGSPNFSFPLPSLSELSSLGVRNVLASYLNYKPSVEVPLSELPASELSLSSSTESYIEIDLSKTEEIEILQDAKCHYLDEHSLSSLDSGTVPSPETEAVLLHESVHLKSSGKSATPTSNPSLNYQKCQEVVIDESEDVKNHLPASSATLTSKDLETRSSAGYEFSETKSLGTVTIPSPPPANQLLEKEYDDSELLTQARTDAEVQSSQSIIDEENHVKSGNVLNSEPLAVVVDSEASLAVPSQVSTVPDEFGNPKTETPDFILDEVLPLLLEAEAALNVDSDPNIEEQTPPSSADATLEEAAQPKQSWTEPWISTDAAENDDNNNPAWERWRKLETDEERYRVVRNQWRQMTIPNPRRDLTSHNYKRTPCQSNIQPGASKISNSVHTQGKSRKRQLDDNDFTSDDHLSKRRRTYSCTTMYENKINTLHNELETQLDFLNAEHDRELFNLSDIQQQTTERIINSTAPSYIVKRQIDELIFHQEREVDGLHAKYNNMLGKITHEKMNNITILEKTKEEVLAFNKFYTDLGDSDDTDHCNISEEELQQFEETEQMFEAYDQIYSQ